MNGKTHLRILSLIISGALSAFIFPLSASTSSESRLYFSARSIADGLSISSSLAVGALTDEVTLQSLDISSPSSCKFSFVSDDGASNDWNFRDIFASRGVSCVLSLVEAYVTGRNMPIQIPLQQVLSLQNDYGYEIGSHSYDHVDLSLLPLEDAIRQMTLSKNSLSDMGLRVNNFFLPFGKYTEDVLDEAEKIYRSTRTSERGPNSQTILSKRSLKVYWLDQGIGMDLPIAKEIVQTARENNQYIIFGFHAGPMNRNYAESLIAPLIDYIQEFEDTQVLTVDKALDRIEGLATPGYDFRIENGEIILDRFFLRSLPNGTNTLTFHFNDGKSEELSLYIDSKASPSFTADIVDTGLPSQPVIFSNNEAFTVQAKISTNQVDTPKATATIGPVSVPGVLKGDTFSFIFSSGDIPSGSYTQLSIEASQNSQSAADTASISLTIQNTVYPISDLISLSLDTLPAKLTYFEGEPLDLSGMTVTGHYTGNRHAAIVDYTAFGNTQTAGTQSIRISYGAFEEAFDILVLPRTYSAISLVSLPEKREYYPGQAINLSGLSVLGTLVQGGTQTVPHSALTVSNYDSHKTGPQTVIISVDGHTVSFPVTVLDVEITGIETTSVPAKRVYVEGEPFDTAGLVVLASYSDGESAPITGYTLSGYQPYTIGAQEISIFYNGHETSFEIQVKRKTPVLLSVLSPPTKTRYAAGEEINLAGISVQALYNNGTTELIPQILLSLEEYSAAEGTRTVYVVYSGLSASFSVTFSKGGIIPPPDDDDDNDIKIVSYVYICDEQTSRISKIPAETTVAKLLSNLSNGNNVKVFSGSSQVSGSALLGTGMTLRLYNGAAVIQTLTAVVTGDINGDGKATLTDYVQIKKILLGQGTFSNAAMMAADLNGDNGVTLTDFVQYKSYLLGKSKIIPN